MKKYKVSFIVEAQDRYKAEEKAGLNRPVDIEEYEEYENWYSIAQQHATDIWEEYRNEINDVIKEQIKAGEMDESEIYEHLRNNKPYIDDRIHEWLDGQFIYNSNDALQEALECLSQLSEWEEDDGGLWEGKTEYYDIINIKAFFTLRNAVAEMLEKQIKQYISNCIEE